MADLDELDRLYVAATAGEWRRRSYQEPSGEFSPARSWKAYDEDNIVLTAALHNAWPEVSARLRAAKVVLRALVACDDAINRGDEPPLSRSELAIAARAALGEP